MAAAGEHPEKATFEAAARAFAALVHRIRPERWTAPGLGEWDLRALVGHTSRSLSTVHTYLRDTAAQHPAADLHSPQEYYLRIRTLSAELGAEAIVERGRQAGRDLGEQPATAVDDLLELVLADLAGAADPVIAVIGGLRIRLSDYLPTRTFELAVHGLDIAAAAELDFRPPEVVLSEATALAARVAVLGGDGPMLLRGLTGRGRIPPNYSVV